jgi:hypothetical protein
MIKQEEWEWYGLPGHFIAANRCQFHLATKVGDVLVSTVGDYYPRGSDKRETIGCDRFFETMVFHFDGECECGCGQPDIIPSEIDFDAYNDAASATAGHMVMCCKWATTDTTTEEE